MNYKKDFPIFATHPELVYLDSAATSQKPQQVIDSIHNFYISKNANVHRGIYHLADEATSAYENARQVVADFVNAKKSNEIVFTANTNQSINFVAYGWVRKFLKKGDIVVLSEMEHHANSVPWIRLSHEIGIELLYLPIDANYQLDYQSIISSYIQQSDSRNSHVSRVIQYDPSKIKLLTLTHVSNVLGTINPIKEIVSFFRQCNKNIKVLIDGAQAIPHFPIDVQDLDVDFYAFSSHKMLGPSGVGVLYAKEELLEVMDPFFVGSHMIKNVTKNKFTTADVPEKFEVGTGNLEGVIGLSTAINYLQGIGLQNIMHHEQELLQYALKRLQAIPAITIYGPSSVDNRLAIFSLGVDGVHPHDIAQILDRNHICVRSGHHCAQVLMNCLNIHATARASFYLYNTKEDVDRLIAGIEDVKITLRV